MTATHRLIKRWCGDSIDLMGTGPVVADQIEQINRSVAELDTFLQGFATARRQPSKDIITALVAHEDRGEITWNAIVAICRSLLTRDSCALPDSPSPPARNRHGANPVFFVPCRTC